VKNAQERESFSKTVAGGSLADLSTSWKSLSRGGMLGLERQLSRVSGQ